MVELERQQETSAQGRRRSDQAHQAIVQATMDVLELVGYCAKERSAGGPLAT